MWFCNKCMYKHQICKDWVKKYIMGWGFEIIYFFLYWQCGCICRNLNAGPGVWVGGRKGDETLALMDSGWDCKRMVIRGQVR